MNTLDFSKPITTRDGRAVRVLATNAINPRYPVVVLVANDNGTKEDVMCYTANGRFVYDQNRESRHDLVNIPDRIRRTLFVNVYPPGYGVNVVHESREKADYSAAKSRLACVQVQIDVEKGHGL